MQADIASSGIQVSEKASADENSSVLSQKTVVTNAAPFSGGENNFY